MSHTFTLGIEEEFQIIDPETRELRSHIRQILDDGRMVLREHVKPKMHPHIYALSVNSPFWLGRNTGLKAYRQMIFERFPRTGIPDAFESLSEYLQIFADELFRLPDFHSFGPMTVEVWPDNLRCGHCLHA